MSENRSLALRLLRQVRPYWKEIGGILLLSVLAPPLALLTPVPLKIAVDSALGGRPLPRFLDAVLPGAIPRTGDGMLIVAVGLLVLVVALSQLRDFAGSILAAYTSERLLRDFRAELFRHVQRLSLSYHERRGTADSTYRIQYDATSLPNIAVDGVVPFITSTLTLAAMIYVSARINLRLALIALAICPLLFLATRHFRSRMRSQSHEIRHLESSSMGVVSEALGAARVVKAFSQEEREQRRFVDRSNRSMRARVRLALSEGSFELLVAVLVASGTALVLFVGIQGVRHGDLTLGELLLVMGYVAQIYSPLKTLGKKVATVQGHMAGAERAFALLDEPPDVPERPDARPLVRARGLFEFRRVRFAYENDQTVVSDLSFVVRPGTCLGVAGATGAGKTTLVSLLNRFYDPSAGQILLDGVDLRDYRLEDLRRQFAIVLQEPVLFSCSIGENIAYARPGAGQRDIVAAAKAAHAHDFIVRLPDGYDTPVGERGMRLSGGERQRVSLARAFLRDAPILILDEPTSSVDAATEAAIADAMRRLMHGRTTFIISHRPSMLEHCGTILNLERGRMVGFAPAEAAAVEGNSA